LRRSFVEEFQGSSGLMPVKIALSQINLSQWAWRGSFLCATVGDQSMLDLDFLTAFKRETEETWSTRSIDPAGYGFQFQRGTRWNPGLTDDMVAEYEHALGVGFPRDFRAFLGTVNGTDLPTLNVYGHCGEAFRQSVGVYAYPRDIEIVRLRIEDVLRNRAEISADLADQGFTLPVEARLVPLVGHRYVMCTSDPESSVVLSIVVDSVDAIVYANSLKEYLEVEFLDRRRPSELD
jgi:hypothetical protein